MESEVTITTKHKVTLVTKMCALENCPYCHNQPVLTDSDALYCCYAAKQRAAYLRRKNRGYYNR